ncbi:hypothetical protein BJ508DRAFT_313542 [Ascobolus immersus RN42]|uniref:Uncharacterized protein n=1 Tax=Ascobolus immersus RN42 TaxID=1160509 RepID=A0A3N4HI98_ASCIM|nr:hypothetical protein BJ508DRAFT_313542 [Ascobolus immersus RN42]
MNFASARFTFGKADLDEDAPHFSPPPFTNPIKKENLQFFEDELAVCERFFLRFRAIARYAEKRLEAEMEFVTTGGTSGFFLACEVARQEGYISCAIVPKTAEEARAVCALVDDLEAKDFK